MNQGIKISQNKVAVNEYVTKYLMRRLQDILIANDITIWQFYSYFCVSGPAVFIDGMSVEKGYKVWANGADGYGIYISLVDNNMYDPEKEEGKPYWKRFTVADIREYNVQVFEIIRSYLNAHITLKHTQGELSDADKLEKTLANIQQYSYYLASIKLGSYTKLALPDGKFLLQYSNAQLIGSEQVQSVSKVNVQMDSAAQYVESIGSTAAYERVGESKNIAQLLDGSWKFVSITFNPDGQFASADYHIMASAKSGDLYVKPYVYGQTKSGFCLAMKYANSDQAEATYVYIHCIGEALQ